MARKSNKTAHVLNLLSGQQDTGGETEKEAEPLPEASKAQPAKQEAAAEPAPMEAQSVPAPSPEVPPNISIIDSAAKEDDPIAERIREELLKDLEQETHKRPESTVPEPVATSEAVTSEPATAPEDAVPEPAAASEAVVPEPVAAPKAATPEPAVTPKAAIPEPVTTSEAVTPKPPAAGPEAAALEPKTPQTEVSASAAGPKPPKSEVPPSPAAETQSVEVPAPPQPEPEEEILELSPEPPAEPEPDYVMLNVMQRVVEDKIIYFMKQFEVCTCDRCKADTIALTLSGLPAKYRIVDKHAVDPLISYYTSRLISQVTVEALKACTQVKDNPRH